MSTPGEIGARAAWVKSANPTGFPSAPHPVSLLAGSIPAFEKQRAAPHPPKSDGPPVFENPRPAPHPSKKPQPSGYRQSKFREDLPEARMIPPYSRTAPASQAAPDKPPTTRISPATRDPIIPRKPVPISRKPVPTRPFAPTPQSQTPARPETARDHYPTPDPCPYTRDFTAQTVTPPRPKTSRGPAPQTFTPLRPSTAEPYPTPNSADHNTHATFRGHVRAESPSHVINHHKTINISDAQAQRDLRLRGLQYGAEFQDGWVSPSAVPESKVSMLERAFSAAKDAAKSKASKFAETHLKNDIW